MKRKISILLCLLMLSFVLASCGSNNTSTATNTGEVDNASVNAETAGTSEDTGSTVRVGITADPGSLSPFVGSSTGAMQTYPTIYEYLFSMGRRGGDIEPNIAKSIEKTDDPLVYRISLFDYVYDSAGNQVKASDVKFSFDTYKATQSNANLEQIEKVEIVDDYTMDWYFTTVSVGSVEMLMTEVPIVSQASYENSENQMATEPITTSQYKVTSYVSGSSITCEKRDDYWQTDTSLIPAEKQANVDTVIFKVITDASQMTIALQTGEIDLANEVSSDDIKQFMNEDGTAKDGYTLKTNLSPATAIMFFNTDQASAFNNIDLRQAIAYAVDSDAIVQSVVNGLGTPCVTAGSSAYGDFLDAWESEDYYNYDPEVAKQYLESSGYDTSVPVRIVSENNPLFQKSAQVVMAYLEEIGVQATYNSYETAMYEATVADPSQWDIYIGFKGSPDYLVSLWRWAFSAHVNNGMTSNFFVDDELQSLLDTSLDVNGGHTDENVNAFHEYLKSIAIVKGLFSPNSYWVGVSGITDITGNADPYIVPNACTFADDFGLK